MCATKLFLFSYSPLPFDHLKITVKILILPIFKICCEWKILYLGNREGTIILWKKSSYLPRWIYYHNSCKDMWVYSIFLLWLSLLWERSQFIDIEIVQVTKFSSWMSLGGVGLIQFKEVHVWWYSTALDSF